MVQHIDNPSDTLDKELSPEGVVEFLNSTYDRRGLQTLCRMRDERVLINSIPTNCRAAVNMPAFYKEKNLYHTLSQYLLQDTEEKGQSFFINVLVNGPKGTNLEQSPPYRDALRFMHEHPNVHVVLHKTHYPKEQVNMSKIRKDATALSLLLASEVPGLDLENLVLFNNDADLQHLESNYVSAHVDTFDSNPRLGAIAGFAEYPVADFYQNHLFLATQRFEDILHMISNSKEDNHILKGGASALRARDYVATGGFDGKTRMSELRSIYKSLRAKDRESVVTSRNIGTVTTSARRQIMALGANVPLAKAHDTFGKQGDLAEKYQASLDELEIPELADKVTSPTFKEKLEVQLNSLYKKMRYMRSRTPASEIDRLFQRAGFYSGIELVVENEQVVIKDMTVLRKNILEKYSHF